MKKITRNIATLMLLTVAATAATAQVVEQKVGDNSLIINPNAVLEIESADRGLLLPRLELKATDNFEPLAAHVEGMTVYNTAASDATVADENKVTPGYYYNDGAKWVRIATGADAKTEPWKVQDTGAEADDNEQDIYQEGKVAVGFTDADGVSDKQLEVKGDFKAETSLEGSLIPGTHVYGEGTGEGIFSLPPDFGDPPVPVNGSGNYFVHADGDYEGQNVVLDAGIMSYYINNVSNILAGSFVHEKGVDFFTHRQGYAESNIRLADDDIHLTVRNFTSSLLSEITILSDGENSFGGEGVAFIFNGPDLTDSGGYTFPRNTGTAGQVMTQTATGQIEWADVNSLVDEPWRVQNTETEATNNLQNIYQEGKVAVGFTDADAVSDKQLEVKGDFKAQVTDGDIIYGTEIDNPLMPAQSTAHYWMNMATGAYKVATVRADAAIIESNGTATSSIFNAEDSHATMASLQKNGNAKSEIRTENIGNFFMETYNVTDNYGSTISLQNDGLRMVHSETEGAGPNWLSQNNKSEIFVEKENGVRFNFRDEDGDVKGEYWFPTTSGTAGQVLKRVGVNETEWSNVSDLIEVSNGLEKNANDTIQLGGDLVKDTKITLDEYELEIDAADSDLIISGLDKTTVQATSATTGITDHLLAVDANNNVKALKAAMPKFFYMPSIIIPTSEAQMADPVYGGLTGDSFDDTALEGTISLYARYNAQFGTTGTTTQPSSPDAPALPVLPASELHYYITWYDTTVFSSVAVDANGVMTYELLPTADVTMGSFMNIVFAVKEDN